MRILLVEDDELLAQGLASTLTENRYVVDIARDGEEGWLLAESTPYDLILMDVDLPRLDGLALCRRLRSHHIHTPILLLTGMDQSTQKVLGLDAGADDYMIKPVDVPELLARIRALLRRSSANLTPILTWDHLSLDPSTCEVAYDERPLSLTRKEYNLLELFLRNNQRVFSCSAIIDHLWSFEEPPTEETVRSHIKGLRQKLRAAGLPNDPIETVYGLGYRLRPLPQADKATSTSPQRPQQPTSGAIATTSPVGRDQARAGPGSTRSEAEQHTLTVVTQVWQRIREKFLQRVDQIAQAADQIKQQRLSPEQQQQARREAHRLAGSLGMFGLAEGTQLARDAEQLLQSAEPLTIAQGQRLEQMAIALRQLMQQTQSAQIPDLLALNPQPLLLLVSSDQQLLAGLQAEAEAWGMRVAIAAPPEADPSQPSVAASSGTLPPTFCHADLVVLDLSPAAGSTTLSPQLLHLLQALNRCQPAVPTVVLDSRDSLSDRLQVVRLGGQAFLQKPIAPAQVLEVAMQVLERSHRGEARVLAVDDDPQVLAQLRTLLEPWGISLVTLTDPLRFWQVLETSAPDLLILDVEMPQVSGIELCRVVRNDATWGSVPVLFLTAYTDAETMHRVFEAGADDFVSKPVVGPELVTRLLNRLERSRLQRQRADLDLLTGLPNRQKFIHDLSLLLPLYTTPEMPLCLAILEVDHLQAVNDQSGYEGGDRLLTYLGEQLRPLLSSQSLPLVANRPVSSASPEKLPLSALPRAHPLLGARWGGAEFVIAFPGVGSGQAAAWLNDLQQQLQTAPPPQQLPHPLTFNIGIAQAPQDGTTVPTLYQAARRALLQVKHQH